MQGTVIRILPNKGYAFIRDENGDSRFAHSRDFRPAESFDRLREGQLVQFTPDDSRVNIRDRAPNDNGMRAREIRIC